MKTKFPFFKYSLYLSCFLTTFSRAATFTVTNIGDSGAGSLRQAIQSANSNFNNNDPSRVEFNIPGAGVQTIVLALGSPLAVSRPVAIDGFTQPGSKPNSLAEGIDAVPLIQLRGELRVIANDCVVRGLVINNSSTTGLTIQGSGCVVEGCFIGTDPTGMVGLGNDLDGIRVGGFSGTRPNRIGGSQPAARNLISGNQFAGITVQSTVIATIIQGNYIGTDATGRRGLGNGEFGIRVFANDNTNATTTIGGTNSVEGNRIAFNGSGVWVATGSRTRILGNSFFSNLHLGLDIGSIGSGATLRADGPTPNDNRDADTGPNGLQNYPILTSVSTIGGTTTIQGTLNSKTNAAHRVEFFANATPDTLGFGEGQQFLGVTNVTTDASGNSSFNVSIPGAHAFITATATDADGNTSEFSRVLISAPAPFAAGDVFVSGNTELVQRFGADGLVRDLLRTDATGEATLGMAFDPSGNLYVAGRENSGLTKFDSQGKLVGPFGSASDGFSWFVRFDGAGNAYVSSALASFGLGKFSPQGALLQEFNLVGAGIGATSFDLSSDARIVYYVLEGATFFGDPVYETSVRRLDLVANQPLTDFAANLPGNVRGVEFLTDGSMLVAIETEILRLNAQGQIVQRYDFFGEDSWSAVARGADDASFWTAGDFGSWIYRFDLASGEMVQRIFIGTVPEPSLLVKRGSVTTTPLPAPATFTVTNTSDSGPGSLRAAIESANAKAGRDTIAFNIPGPGPHLIRPASVLPEIIDSVVIDGYSQSGSQMNNAAAAALQVIQVVLDGSNAGPLADGLSIVAAQSVVKGLAIVRFSGNGLVLAGHAGNQVFGNYIGIDPADNSAGNLKHGILVADSWLNQIGTGNPANFNVISANGGSGVAFQGASAGGNLVGRNFIGTGRTAEKALGNGGSGVLVTQSENTIGSAGGLGGNVIAFNRGAGVEVYGSLDQNRFRVWRFQEASGVLIQANLIYSNGGLGIDLMPSGVNVNDEGTAPDRDNGPNNRLNYPRLNPALTGSSSVSGDWSSPGNSSVTIELFANAECDPSGYGEGRTLLGRTEATADASGKATFTVSTSRPLIEGEFVTAVAIGGNNETSEFTPCVRVSQPADLEVTIVPTPSPVPARADLTYTITVRNNGPGPATDVRYTNSIPMRTDFVSTTLSCERDFSGFLHCQWTSIPAGQSVTATMVIQPKFVGSLSLLAFAAAAELDPNLTNNAAATVTAVTGQARTLTVVNTNDTGAGSVRAALEQLNAQGVGLDTITFNIPGSGVKVIKPASDLPRIEVPVTIDGYTQPGSRPNALASGSDAVILIEIQGSPLQTNSSGAVLIGTGVPNGLQFTAPGCVVRGLSIHSCAQTGIRIDTRDPLPGDAPTVVEGCFIGVGASGRTARGNLNSGIDFSRGNARIGGLTPAARNVISANGNPQQQLGTGIIVGSSATAVIQGNLIGTDATSVVLFGNLGAGIEVRSSPGLLSIIGGRESGAANTIAFNNGSGINAPGHTIVGNSIFANGALGLGGARPTVNDAGDPLPVGFDGAVQNYPNLSSAVFDGAATKVTGLLRSRTNETFSIDFYANTKPDDSFFGEGEIYLGSTEVTTDAAGNGAFSASFNGQHPLITATATDARGRTSEFSASVPTTTSSVVSFAVGDLAISLDTGYVQWRRADGTLVGLLDTGLHQSAIIQNTAGAAFDPQANLSVSGRHLLQTGNSNAPISRFSPQGTFAGVFGALGTRPLGMTFDTNGNLFAASPETGSDVTKYSNAGQVLEKFGLPNERGTNSTGSPTDLAVQWIELSADQRTLYYTSEGAFLVSGSKQIKRYDLVSKTTLPDFASNLPGTDAQQFRLLPDGGGILADMGSLLRFDANGQPVRTYDADGEDQWSHVALTADGQSFWAAGRVSVLNVPLFVYRFDLATGQVLGKFTVGASVAIHALAVNSTKAAGVGPRLEFTLGPNGRVRISWPGDAPDYRFEATASLTSPIIWSVVTPAPVVEAGQFVYRTDPTESARFYRLHKP